MSPWFPQIHCRSWVLATIAGALLAYVLGYLPSTLISLMQPTSDVNGTIAEPSQGLVLLLAAGLGTVTGEVLSSALYLVIRGKVTIAGIWIPADMLAWIVGMPGIFSAIDIAYRMPSHWLSVPFLALMLLVTGAIVGAIHGAALLILARRNPVD